MNDVGDLGRNKMLVLYSYLRRRKYVRFVTNDRPEVQLDIKKEVIPRAGCQILQLQSPIIVLQLTPDTW